MALDVPSTLQELSVPEHFSLQQDMIDHNENIFFSVILTCVHALESTGEF